MKAMMVNPMRMPNAPPEREPEKDSPVPGMPKLLRRPRLPTETRAPRTPVAREAPPLLTVALVPGATFFLFVYRTVMGQGLQLRKLFIQHGS